MFKYIAIKRGMFEIREVLKVLENKNAFICGGYARYCASPLKNPVPSSDLDIYSKDEQTFEELKKYFIETECLGIKHENKMAITFGMPEEGKFSNCPAIQMGIKISNGMLLQNYHKENHLI